MAVINCIVQHNLDETIKITSTNEINNTETIDLSSENEQNTDIDNVKFLFRFVPDITKITSLNLTMCFLKTVPDCLGLLPLKELNVSNNFLKDLPKCLLLGLNHLRILNLSKNEFRSIVEQPKCLVDLEEINLSFNQLKELPFWLTEEYCPNLRSLDLSVNDLKNPFFNNTFKKLDKLFLRNCNFYYIDNISKISGIQYLSIGNDYDKKISNCINELIFLRLNFSHTLIELDLAKLGITLLSEDIDELVSLKTLLINNNFLTLLPDNIVKLKNLKTLNVSNNELISLPENMHELENLTELYLANNILSSIPNCIINSNIIQIFDGYNNYLTESSYDLMYNESLHSVDLERNCFQTDNRFEQDKYLQKKYVFRKEISDERMDGMKEDEEDSVKSDLREETDEDFSCERIVTVREENWDDYDIDEHLFLAPCKVVRRSRSYNYGPALLDPSYYEDSPEDTT